MWGATRRNNWAFSLLNYSGFLQRNVAVIYFTFFVCLCTWEKFVLWFVKLITCHVKRHEHAIGRLYTSACFCWSKVLSNSWGRIRCLQCLRILSLVCSIRKQIHTKFVVNTYNVERFLNEVNWERDGFMGQFIHQFIEQCGASMSTGNIRKHDSLGRNRMLLYKKLSSIERHCENINKIIN